MPYALWAGRSQSSLWPTGGRSSFPRAVRTRGWLGAAYAYGVWRSGSLGDSRCGESFLSWRFLMDRVRQVVADLQQPSASETTQLTLKMDRVVVAQAQMLASKLGVT